jgi:hypothetical protein
MNELLRRRVEKLAAGMSPDEKRHVAGWGLRLLAALSPQEAAEDIERSLDLFSDEDRAQAREALLAVRADYIARQESTVAPLHSGVATGHHPVTPHADGPRQIENDAPRPTRANPISARYPHHTRPGAGGAETLSRAHRRRAGPACCHAAGGRTRRRWHAKVGSALQGWRRSPSGAMAQ